MMIHCAAMILSRVFCVTLTLPSLTKNPALLVALVCKHLPKTKTSESQPKKHQSRTQQISDHSNGLALNVWHLASVVKGHMGSLPVCITSRLSQGLWVEIVRDHLSIVRCLWGEQVPRNLLSEHRSGTIVKSMMCNAFCAASAHDKPRQSEMPLKIDIRFACSHLCVCVFIL